MPPQFVNIFDLFYNAQRSQFKYFVCGLEITEVS